MYIYSVAFQTLKRRFLNMNLNGSFELGKKTDSFCIQVSDTFRHIRHLRTLVQRAAESTEGYSQISMTGFK